MLHLINPVNEYKIMLTAHRKQIFYYIDGYIDIVYPGRHICNVHDKKDIHNVESINADLHHYIPVLARKNRCFARRIEALYAVVAVFVDAYSSIIVLSKLITER